MISTRYKSTFTQKSGPVELTKEFPKIMIETGHETWGQLEQPTLDLLRFYPPELPNQKYIRTYKLRRGWKAFIHQIDPRSFAVTISNAVDYTSFVVGSLALAESVAASFQADIHKGRWPLATITAKKAFADFLQGFDKNLSNKLSKYGTVRRTRQ